MLITSVLICKVQYEDYNENNYIREEILSTRPDIRVYYNFLKGGSRTYN